MHLLADLKDLPLPPPLKWHHTWEVNDSSKGKCYMECPRKYFYRYILGWELEGPNIHKEFGSAMHKAMEIMMSAEDKVAAIPEAYLAFEEYYRQFFGPEDDEVYAPKSPLKALELLSTYATRYADDQYKVVSFGDTPLLEISGAAPLDDQGRAIHFRIDAAVTDGRFIHLFDHKTGSRYSTMWENGFRNDYQIKTYLHALYCLVGTQLAGAIIQGLFPYKKQPCDIYRVPIRVTPIFLEQWRRNAMRIYDEILADYQHLSETGVDDPILEAFPMRTVSCTKYGTCAYFDLCIAWQNPLPQADLPPVGFQQKFWDPRVEDRTTRHMDIAKESSDD